MKLTPTQIRSLAHGIAGKKIKTKLANHELWFRCRTCGTYNDRRKTKNCLECNEPLKYKHDDRLSPKRCNRRDNIHFTASAFARKTNLSTSLS